MLPVGEGMGQIWLLGKYLCEVEYFVGEPMRHVGNSQVQRVILILEDEHCEKLVDAYELNLVLKDDTCVAIPRPLQSIGLGCLECYVES
jgi:hypothetical protein